jgi:Zn-dependent protease/CBS domain-containing protein
VGLLAVLLATGVLPFLAPGQDPGVYALAAVATALAFVLSLLAHEVAHTLVALRYGLPVRRITVWLLGGVSELGGRASRPEVEMRVAIAGPLVSLGLGVLFLASALVGGSVGWAALVLAPLTWLGTTNVVIGVFNLLPGTPLDGGRLLHGLVWRRTGDRARATHTATSAGLVLGAVVAGVGVLLVVADQWDGLWLALVGWFLARSATEERTSTTVLESLVGLAVRDVMTPAPAVVPGWWTVQGLLEHLAGPDGTRHRAFPVVDVAGRPLGVVCLADLVAVRAAARPVTAVEDLLRTPPLVLAATDPMERLLERPPTAGRDLVLVADAERVVGVVSAGDLERVVLLRATNDQTPTR